MNWIFWNKNESLKLFSKIQFMFQITTFKIYIKTFIKISFIIKPGQFLLLCLGFHYNVLHVNKCFDSHLKIEFTTPWFANCYKNMYSVPLYYYVLIAQKHQTRGNGSVGRISLIWKYSGNPDRLVCWFSAITRGSVLPAVGEYMNVESMLRCHTVECSIQHAIVI